MRALIACLAVLCGLALADAGGSWRGGGVPNRGGGSYKGGGSWGPPRGYHWPSKYNCRQRGCFKPCPNPKPVTAWDYISNNPELTFLTKLLTGTPFQAVLQGPFNLTLLAPTDEAFDRYYSSFDANLRTLLDNDPDRTGPFWEIVNRHFWPRLLAYHVLTEPVYAKDLEVGTWYTTIYESSWGPHKVYFGSKDVPITPGATVNKYAKPCRSCKSLKYYLLDEQNKETTIKQADKFVVGGGAIHVINGVLNPNNVYPSALAALKFANFTSLIGAIDYVAASAWSSENWRYIETTPGTFVAPNNEAFMALVMSVGGQLPSADVVSEVLHYHSCPLFGDDATASNLLYSPFTTGINPALTTLGWRQSNSALTLEFKDGPIVVSVETGGVAGIIVPDVTTPLGVAHGVNSVLLPPGIFSGKK